jgi:myo-inositol-1(or 4)-monophosphatase
MASRDLEFIQDFLRRNWDYVLEKYRDKSRLTVTSKADPADLLTEVDLTIQKRFIDAVAEIFPTDLVVGEEGDLGKIPANPRGRVWVIDPIDGTYNFVRGMNPMFGISIALVVDGLARVAGVGFPMGGQVFLAEQGEGSFCNGRPLRVSDVQHLAEACVEIDFNGPDDRKAFLSRATGVIRHAGQIRCQGAAVGGICQIATGDVDGYLHMALYPWDYAAAQLIAEEAGAVATRLDGSPLRVFDGREGVLISNGAVHEALLGCITHP